MRVHVPARSDRYRGHFPPERARHEDAERPPGLYPRIPGGVDLRGATQGGGAENPWPPETVGPSLPGNSLLARAEIGLDATCVLALAPASGPRSGLRRLRGAAPGEPLADDLGANPLEEL